MSDLDLYSTLLNCCHLAFEKRQYLVSYHALSSAMYCCLQTKNARCLEEIVQLAYDHISEITKHLGNPVFPDEPIELSLYRSLIQMARSKLLLSRK